MELDIQALDERIKSFQLIRQKLSSDPELATWVRALLGNGVVDTASTQATTPGAPTDKSARDAAIAKLKGVRLEVFNRVPESGEGRTAKDITERLKQAGHKWRSKDHLLTVKEQLRELEWVKLVEKAGAQKDGSALWRRCP